MPDYLGDRATVFPDNTQAIMHWSNVFEQRRRERDAQKRADELAERQRRFKIYQDIGDTLTSKEFKDGYVYQDIINNGLDSSLKWLTDAYREGMPDDQMYAGGLQRINALRDTATKAQALKANITKGVAETVKRDKWVDPGALTDLAVYSATHEDGKLKPIGDVDVNAPWVQNVFRDRPDVIYKAEDYAKANDEFWKGRPTSKVNDPDTYDEKTGNQIRRGYVGQIPEDAEIVYDPNTKLPMVSDNGSPVLDVRGSENYRLPGTSTDFKDDKGNTVKVLGDDAFNRYYQGPRRAEIERRIEPALKAKGESSDSEYADMLRRKEAHDMVLGDIKGRYNFTIPKDQSFDRRQKLLSQQMARRRLALSEQRNAREARKEKKEADDNLPQPLMEKYQETKARPYSVLPNVNPGQVFKNDQGKPMLMIDVKDIDKGDYRTIFGGDSGKDDATTPLMEQFGLEGKGGKEPIVKPYGDKTKYYLIDPDSGDWYGDGGQVVDFDAAYDRQLKFENPIKKSKAALGKRGGARGVMDKVMSGIRGLKKGGGDKLK